MGIENGIYFFKLTNSIVDHQVVWGSSRAVACHLRGVPAPRKAVWDFARKQFREELWGLPAYLSGVHAASFT